MKRFFLFFLVALFLLGVDFALKWYVVHNIPLLHSSVMAYPYGGIALFKDWHGIDFSIVQVNNRGAAWGLFASAQEYLLYVRVALIGALISYLCFAPASSYRKWSLLFVTAGALGNVVDSFLYGHVVDMFYFVLWGYSYPVFNFADSLIFVGILLLVFEWMFKKRSAKKT